MSKKSKMQKPMRIFVVLICSLALVSLGYAAREEHKPEEKKKRARHTENATERERQPERFGRHGEEEKARRLEEEKARRLEAARRPVKLNKPIEPLTTKAKPLKPIHHAHRLILPNKPSRLIAPVRYDPARRLVGSEHWVGRDYAAFRLYRPVWHDRFWWRNHYSRVVLISGGWYYWNAGFWYPAWGYDPAYAYYPYDGPIYAYNNLPPDQVIGNVQEALQQQGYYHGTVDGLLGPLTRAAIADYQRDHRLYVTSAIDHPTLQSLGMA